MKVCIPCTGTGSGAHVHSPYGEAEHLSVWNLADGTVQYHENPFAGKDHVCACATTRWAGQQQVHAFIAGDIGKHAASRLTQSGIQVYLAGDVSVDDALRALQAGTLRHAPTEKPAHAGQGHCGGGHHHHGNGTCHGHEGGH